MNTNKKSYKWSLELFRKEAANIIAPLANCDNLTDVRRVLFLILDNCMLNPAVSDFEGSADDSAIVRDCMRVFRVLLRERSDERAGFSVAQALWDIARGIPRPELQPAFFAEITHLAWGLDGRFTHSNGDVNSTNGNGLVGREAAAARSEELDRMSESIEARMQRYASGLTPEAVARRADRRREVLAALNGKEADWEDWQWQTHNIIQDSAVLAKVINAAPKALENAAMAMRGRLPFGITPYYASLIDNDPEAGRDRAIRAQVLPSYDYVTEMLSSRDNEECSLDFMREADTSPIDLITRRYPGIAIFKP